MDSSSTFSAIQNHSFPSEVVKGDWNTDSDSPGAMFQYSKCYEVFVGAEGNKVITQIIFKNIIIITSSKLDTAMKFLL